MNKAKLTHFQSFIKNPTLHHESNLKGQIYELFCYEYIIEHISNYKIVISNISKKKKYASFSYSSNGKINYHSGKIHLAEFDILGISDDTIFWCETTMSDKNHSALNTEIARKRKLLENLFPHYKIDFNLIIPHRIIAYNSYNCLIINEPNYLLYFNSEYYNFHVQFDRCVSLEELDRMAHPYSYIHDIFAESLRFFSGDSTNINNLKNSHMIERLYDIKNIQCNRFQYLNIADEKLGIITIAGKKIYKDRKLVKSIKKTFQEVKDIRKLQLKTASTW